MLPVRHQQGRLKWFFGGVGMLFDKLKLVVALVVLTFIPDPDGGAFCLLRVVLNALGKKPCGEIAFDAASHKINIELAAFGWMAARNGGFQFLAYGGRQRLFSARAAASASSAAGRRTGFLRFSRFLRSAILRACSESS